MVFILLSCQSPDEKKWVTFEPKNETEIYNEPASTENKESDQSNQSTPTIRNDKVIVNKPNFHPESNFAMLSNWLRINQFLSDNKSV